MESQTLKEAYTTEPTMTDEELKEQLINLKEADPMEIIKAAAEGIGLVLKDPNPHCKKCFGRGWIGRHADTGEPVPCTCIYPVKANFGMPMGPRNRAERRKYGK